MKTISTKVDSQVYQQLLESCGKSNCSVSEKIRNLIEQSLDGKPSIPTTSKQGLQSNKDDGFEVKVNIIPELSHDIKTESNYVIVNGQYFKKCEPLPKARNVRIIS